MLEKRVFKHEYDEPWEIHGTARTVTENATGHATGLSLMLFTVLRYQYKSCDWDGHLPWNRDFHLLNLRSITLARLAVLGNSNRKTALSGKRKCLLDETA